MNFFILYPVLSHKHLFFRLKWTKERKNQFFRIFFLIFIAQLIINSQFRFEILLEIRN